MDEAGYRYVLYADFAERARLAGDSVTYQRYVDYAAFWFVVSTFGRAEAKRL
jgi:hypothetical protein